MYYPKELLETDLKRLYKQCPSKSRHTCPCGFNEDLMPDRSELSRKTNVACFTRTENVK